MQVNNIIIDNDLTSLNSNEYNIIYQNKTTIINIMGKVYINDFSNNLNQQNLTINLKENSSLIYNKYSNQNLEDYQLTINSSDNTEFKLNFSVIAKKPLNININNLIKGNNNASTIRLRIIGEQDVNAIVSAQVLKNTKNNTILEDLKGLNVYAKKIAIHPELLIASEDVVANHLMTISNIDNNELFSLMSKGLSKTQAINLLQKGFIYAIQPDIIKNK